MYVHNLKKERCPAVEQIPKDEYKFTKEARKKFLKMLSETGNIAVSCQFVSISTSYLYQRKLIDEELTAEINEAKDIYRGTIEAEIKRRAIDGVVEYKYHQGLPVLDYELDKKGNVLLDEENNPKILGPAFIRHYSDTLLLAHARRHMPEYNEKKTVDMKVSGLEELLGELKPSTGLPSEDDEFKSSTQTRH